VRETMNSKERIKKALNHIQPNKIPIDFGATALSGFHVSCVEKLREHFGLEKRPVKAYEPYQMLGLVEDDLAEAMKVDFNSLSTDYTMFGFKNENWKLWQTPWGQKVLVAENFKTTKDKSGDTLIYPQGDLSAPARGRMPKSGYFFDAIIIQDEIDEDNLNPNDNLEEFQLLTDKQIEEWKTAAKKLEGVDKGIIAGLPGTCLGDIALVPAVFMKHPKGIRSIDEWYMSTAIRTDYLHEVYDKQTDIAIKNLEKLLPVIKDQVDAVITCGTDFGTQDSTFCSPKKFKSLYLPYYQKVNNWIHKNTDWKIFKHSCGAIKSFMPLFIEAGFDIINPVQCSATGMDPKELKEQFGDQIVFWGGCVDTQHTLPFGTPEDVRKEVLNRCEIFSPNGGYIFNAIHNIQANTPTENIVAMLDAVHEFNGD
jgi:hypothetical protein